MSKKLSLKEALERPADAPVSAPAPSGSPIRVALRAKGEITRPVDLARLLVKHGLSLRKAHEALNRIADGQSAFVELCAESNDELFPEFKELGVVARILAKPDVDVREVRNRLGLSQSDFAVRFGFEVDTIQNWEQGRNKPDAAALLLLRIIERHPEVVDNALIDDR